MKKLFSILMLLGVFTVLFCGVAMAAEEAAKAETRHLLTRSLGNAMFVAVETSEHLLLNGDVLLLCSDGLTDMLVDDQIQELLSLSLGSDEKIRKLIEAANSAGGYDNITVALCEVI